MILAIYQILQLLLDVLKWIIIVQAVLSWLMSRRSAG